MKKWETPEVMKLEVSNTEHGGHGHGHGGNHGKPGNDKDHGWGCPDFKPEISLS